MESSRVDTTLLQSGDEEDAVRRPPSEIQQWQIAAAASVSTLISLGLGILSLVCLIVPHSLASFVDPALQDHALVTLLIRITGGILLSQVCTTFVLASLPLLFCKSIHSNTELVVFKCRTALVSQAVVGLLLIGLGLLDDDELAKTYDGIILPSLVLLCSGTLVLILACIAMMFSFWPVATVEEETSRHTSSCCGSCFTRRPSSADTTEQQARDYHLLSTSEDQDEEQPQAEEQETSDELEDAVSPTSRIRGTRRLLQLAAPEVGYLYMGCTVLLIRLPFSLAIPHFVSTTLGALSRADFGGARSEILWLFLLGSVDAALDFWCVFWFGYANQRIVRDVRTETFQSILKQEVAFFDKNTSGALASRLNSDCGEMAGDLTWFFRFSIESIVRITGITIYMLVRSPLLGACALSIIPIVAVVNKKYGDWLRKNAIAVQDAQAAANSVAQEALSCVRTVIAFASEQHEYEKYREKIDHQYRLNIRQLFMTGFYYMSISTFLINTVVQASLLLYGAYLIEENRLSVEVLLAFMLYQGQLQNETLNLFQSYSSLIKSSGAGDKVFALLDRSPKKPGTGSAEVLATESSSDTPSTSSSSEQYSVSLQNVHFRYPSRPNHTVLRGLSLEIPQGKTVALVGQSGCGKSTVVSLLQRFYDPTDGTILADGVDLASLDIKKHRRQIGVVTQDPTLFDGTILDNIKYGSVSATREDVVEAAKMANSHEFIQSLPGGYLTSVGERGVQLSGGQKQRIAIARAIVKQPSLLLLDEATSALDAEAEHVVQEALDRLLSNNKDMTTVIIAHRLRTVRNADMIACLSDGVVAELGTHGELVQRPNGIYHRMVARASTSGQLPSEA